MSLKHVLLGGGAALVTTASLFACTLPPVQTPEQSFTVKYSQFIPSAMYGVPLPTVPAIDPQKAPVSTVPVPAEAHTVKLASVILNLKLQNNGPIPLQVKIFLSGESTDPYSQPALGGDQAQIDLPAKGPEVSKSFPIDTALLQQQNLKLGFTFGSPGAPGPITFQDSDSVVAKESTTIQVKVF
jgi:hypothetical protein